MESADFHIMFQVDMYEYYRLQKEHFPQLVPSQNLFWKTVYSKPDAEQAHVT
jgi:hypothetical protein